MLITFKSPAAGDVLMLGAVGQKMLQIIGKDPDSVQGIVTLEQLPQAIAALDAARAEDVRHASADNEDDEDAPRGMAAPVSLSQRIAPLLELMRYAQRDGEVVIWNAT